MTWFLGTSRLAIVLGTILIAQTDPLSGGAGWVGAGLLGLVLGWLLLVHLPAKDKQLQMLLDTKDKHVGELITHFRQESKDLRVEFKEALNVIETHSNRRMNELTVALRGEFERLHELNGLRGGLAVHERHDSKHD